MPSDPRVDAYIAEAAPFAQPILTHVRELVHRTLPETDEGIKWGMPAFMIGGKNLAGMAAFKAHCAITIHGDGRQGAGEGMGGYGKIAALSDMPGDDVLADAILAAARRIANGGSALEPRAKKPPVPLPEDLKQALAEVPNAKAVFDGFAPSHRREYLEWITEAKRPETRARRIAQTIEWLAEGRKRNWKYEDC